MVAGSGHAQASGGRGDRDGLYLPQSSTARPYGGRAGEPFSDALGASLQWTRAALHPARFALGQTQRQTLDLKLTQYGALRATALLATLPPFCGAKRSNFERWRRGSRASAGEGVPASALASGPLAHRAEGARLGWGQSGRTSPHHGAGMES